MDTSIIYNNKKLTYRLEGNGLPVMLIHGFAEDGTIWAAIGDRLKSEYKFIVPDLPGSGNSELSAPLSIDSMAEACKAVLDQEAIDECVVIGHSMGGYVSLALAEKYPALVAALGLFHSFAAADDEQKKESRKKNIAFIRSHGTEAFLKQATPTLFSERSKSLYPEMVNSLINQFRNMRPDSLMAYQQAMISRPDRTHVLENIVKPVLFIIGKEDKAIPYDLSIRQSHLPSISYVHVLEGSGHMGMMEEFNNSLDILQNFLSDLQRQP